MIQCGIGPARVGADLVPPQREAARGGRCCRPATAVSAALLSFLLGGAGLFSPHSEAQHVQVQRIDGSSAEGRIVRIAESVELQTAAGPLRLGWDEMMSLRPASLTPAPAPAPGGLTVELADGSVLTGRIVDRADGAALEFFGGTVRLDPRHLSEIRLAGASAAANARLAELRAEPDAGQDVLVAARGADSVVLRGVVKQVEAERITFTWNDKDTPIPWSRVAGVRFARPTVRGASGVVILHGGDVLAGRASSEDGQRVLLRSGLLGEVALEWSQIDRIEWRSERLVYLSTLRPARYEHTPLFDRPWPYRFDRTIAGGPIRLGGRAFERGVVLHSRSSLVFGLDGGFESFVATAGLLDEVRERGAVTLRVIGDGRTLWEAAGVRGGQPPREAVVRIRGVHELILEVDYDDDLDVGDHAAFAAARLIRADAP
ncbi:MAG: NPCBM/NEW2 domain-containing protein [Phycisphaerales bacterium]|nr:NPCBM/NEW2 domain-containing protein [Phycisphaerales bacterium]